MCFSKILRKKIVFGKKVSTVNNAKEKFSKRYKDFLQNCFRNEDFYYFVSFLSDMHINSGIVFWEIIIGAPNRLFSIATKRWP